MNPSRQFAELFALPVEQRLQLAEDLWDSVDVDAGALPVPEWQIEELERRAASFAAGDGKTYTWEQVKHMLREGR
jgi:putative addiction module component (TIGR02574 family)